VIGGGAAGICVGRTLVSGGLDVLVFEASGCVGGVWNYRGEVGGFAEEIGSVDCRQNRKECGWPMYENLRVNLPKEVMAFPGRPMDKSLPSFVTHRDVASYLEGLAEEIHNILRLHTPVVKVAPVEPCNPFTGYHVTSKEKDGGEKTETFDAVVVCNGHFSKPNIPRIEGMELFRGQLIHSVDYREPYPFKGMRVVVLGAGASGIDISIDISHIAKATFLSYKDFSPKQRHFEADNLVHRPCITKLDADGTVWFSDGTYEKDIDVVIFSTGYEYSFPFLAEECGISIRDNVVDDLYQHLLPITRPTLCFIGLVTKVAPFPIFHYQAHYLLSLFRGKTFLPTVDEMRRTLEEDRRIRKEEGLPFRFSHMMNARQWEYNRFFADRSNQDPLAPVMQKIYDDTSDMRRNDPEHYRSREYFIVSDDEFRVLCNGEDVTPPQ